MMIRPKHFLSILLALNVANNVQLSAAENLPAGADLQCEHTNPGTHYFNPDVWARRTLLLQGIASKGVSGKITKKSATRSVAAGNLKTASRDFRCGDVIEVLDGVVTGGVTLRPYCIDAEPLIVRAKNPLKVVMKSLLKIAGSGIALSGFAFQGSSLTIEGPGSNRVSSCKFSNAKSIALLIQMSPYNEIDYNEFTGYLGIGLSVKLNPITPESSRSNWLHHNYFHDNDKTPGDNGFEAIRVSSDSFHPSYTVIERNLLRNVAHLGEPEAISIKTSSALVLGNTLIDEGYNFDPNAAFEWGYTAVVNRQGLNNLYSQNTLIATGAREVRMEIFGERNAVIRNSFTNASLTLNVGEATGNELCTQLEVGAPCYLKKDAQEKPLLDSTGNFIYEAYHIAARLTLVNGNSFVRNAQGRRGSLVVGGKFWRRNYSPSQAFCPDKPLLSGNNIVATFSLGATGYETINGNASGSTVPPISAATAGTKADGANSF